MKTINLNDYVEVTLTESGARILNAKNNYYNKLFNKNTSKVNYVEGDLYKDQLWSMINLFHSTCSLGNLAFCGSAEIRIC